MKNLVCVRGRSRWVPGPQKTVAFLPDFRANPMSSTTCTMTKIGTELGYLSSTMVYLVYGMKIALIVMLLADGIFLGSSKSEDVPQARASVEINQTIANP